MAPPRLLSPVVAGLHPVLVQQVEHPAATSTTLDIATQTTAMTIVRHMDAATTNMTPERVIRQTPN